MEVGSGSSSTSAKFNDNKNISDRDSLHGLKFGKKIYFEAAGSGGGSGRPPPVPAKKGRSGAVQGGAQPPRCQVEGCKVDLSDAKTYYSRHKVCSPHSKSPMVIVGGIQQRFCQQCSRFHQLHEFDQGKRSCRRRLAGHNERRRKPQPGALLSTRFGTLSSSLFETNNRPGSFLMDFSSYSSLSGRDLWPNARTSPNTQPVAKPLQPELPMQGSASRGPTAAYIAAGASSGECYASRALSLLSTQSWDTRNQSSSLGTQGTSPRVLGRKEPVLESWDARNQSSSLGTQGLLRPPVARPSGFQGGAHDYFSGSPWGFKGRDNSNAIPTDLGLRQRSEAAVNQYSGDVGAAHQPSGRESLGLEYSRGYQNMNWSL